MSEAEDNLDEILHYGFTHWDGEAALLFLENLKATITILSEYPKLGKIVSNTQIENMDTELRSISYKQYQVYYTIGGDAVHIVSIIPKGRPGA
ncbi:MAG: type II toxin-antitoxin system RelE/ParE family toxin [Robiginitomaculum sp.]|nr:type II toxin-antitoxin system RelE/ParE family toxin [Robiginitomaculum sp.]